MFLAELIGQNLVSRLNWCCFSLHKYFKILYMCVLLCNIISLLYLCVSFVQQQDKNKHTLWKRLQAIHGKLASHSKLKIQTWNEFLTIYNGDLKTWKPDKLLYFLMYFELNTGPKVSKKWIRIQVMAALTAWYVLVSLPFNQDLVER